jgi:hypothetical protein
MSQKEERTIAADHADCGDRPKGEDARPSFVRDEFLRPTRRKDRDLWYEPK